MIVKVNDIKWEEKYPIFCSEQFLKTESREYGWICGYIDDRLICFIPFFIYKKLFFKIARITCETYFLEKQYQEKFEQIFLEQSIEIFKQKSIDFIMQPTTNVVFNKTPKKSISALFASYIIDLTQDEDRLWKNLHGKHRNVIKNSEKKGVTIQQNDFDLEELYQMISSTFERSKMSFMSFKKFQEQINNLQGNVEIFTAKSNEGVLQGCAIIPYSGYGGYYLHGGSIKSPITGAMNHLQWNVILRMKMLGVQQYDFVGARINPIKGSKLEGIQRFKQRFGATMHEGYLWKYPIIPWKSKLFTFIYRLLKKSEGDIIDQERIKLK